MKRVYIAGQAFSNDFFDVNIEDMEITMMPYIEVAPYHVVKFGFTMGDNGLEGSGIHKGDFILVSDFSMEPIFDRPVVIRQEGQFLVRVAAVVNPVEGIFITSPDDGNRIQLPSENYRIIGVISGVIPGKTPLHHPYDEYHSDF